MNKIKENEHSNSISGNRKRFFSAVPIQAKLKINEVGDDFEKEADQIAEKIDKPVPIQKTNFLNEEENESGIIQAKFFETNDENPPDQITIEDLKTSAGKPIEKGPRIFMENKIGENFKDVKIHTDNPSIALNEKIGARAFAYKNHLYFNRNQYNPTSKPGAKLLAHELVHVKQQKSNFKQNNNLIQRTPWYKPWLREFTFSPSSIIQYANIEAGSQEAFDTGWERDAVGTGLLSAVAGLATTVLARRIGLKDMLALIAGGASAFGRGYYGYHVQERVWGNITNMHNWYGRYQINILSGNVTAVDFHGVGPTVRTMVAPYHYQQRVADAEGNIIYTHWRHDLNIPGVNISNHTSLPERSFGSFD